MNSQPKQNVVQFTQKQLDWLRQVFPECTDPKASDAELRRVLGTRQVIAKIASLIEFSK